MQPLQAHLGLRGQAEVLHYLPKMPVQGEDQMIGRDEKGRFAIGHKINLGKKFSIDRRKRLSEALRNSPKMHGPQWNRRKIKSDEELKNLYWNKGLRGGEIAKMFGCTPQAVYFRMKQAGIPIVHKGWSEEELEKLRKFYPTSTIDELLKLLPGSSPNRIYLEAIKLGLKKAPETLRAIKKRAGKISIEKSGLRGPMKNFRCWSSTEVATLKKLFNGSTELDEEIASKLGRSTQAIRTMASREGLKKTIPSNVRNSQQRLGREGEILAEKFFDQQGWVVEERGTFTSSYDFVVVRSGKKYPINVKHGKSLSLDWRNVERMKEFGNPSILFIDKKGNVFFMPIEWVGKVE